MSRLRQVGDEGHHHANIHTCADGDGESSQEQSPSGGDAGQREVSLGDSFAGLDRQEKESQRGGGEMRGKSGGGRVSRGQRE